MRGEADLMENVQGILEQELFARTITRERKRSERSGLAMALVSVELQGGRRSEVDSRCGLIATALSSIQSDIDLVGWCESRASIGLLCLELNPESLAATCDRLDAQCRYALARQADATLAQEVVVRLRVYPEPWKADATEQPPMDPVFFPELHANPQGRSGVRGLKRGVDVLLSLLLLLLLSPVLVVLAALVKLSSPGPVIFRQVRVGQMMRPFMMWKFRTMYVNADHGIHHHYVSWFITSSDKGREQSKTAFFKLTNDTRITPIGHFLRRNSLDELPQLWNVVIGDMSLVGPRPPLWYELQQYKPWHRSRVLEAKPGITGLWQVVGRSRTTFDDMVRLDLRYARTMSLWGDIKILLATPAAVITGKGAC